jgi:ElaB/YqjD/DUF883 family membrane-anchored ribosome-binding protein
MGDTIEAIGYKADVKSRTKDKVNRVMGRASEATPSTGDVKQGAQQAVSVAQENPLGLAIGAAAVGFIAGMVVPSTRVENEKLGPMSDQLKDQVKETGQEALERGKQVAQEAAQSAQETARESGQQQAQELASSASPSA